MSLSNKDSDVLSPEYDLDEEDGDEVINLKSSTDTLKYLNKLN